MTKWIDRGIPLLLGFAGGLALMWFVSDCRNGPERQPIRYELQHASGGYVWKLNRISGHIEVCGNIGGQIGCKEAQGSEQTLDNGTSFTFVPVEPEKKEDDWKVKGEEPLKK